MKKLDTSEIEEDIRKLVSKELFDGIILFNFFLLYFDKNYKLNYEEI